MILYKCDRCGKILKNELLECFVIEIEPPKLWTYSEGSTKYFAGTMHFCQNCMDKLNECIDKTEPDCETCRHWWKSEEVCLLDNCHYEPETEPQTIPIKKTMTGSKGERIEYSEAEMIVRDDERSDANDSRRTDQKTE